MREHIPILVVALLLLLTSAAAAEVEIKTFQQSYLLGTARLLNVDMSFGEIRVEGYDGSEVQVEFRLTCKREDLEKCRRRAERLQLVPRVKGQKLVVRLKRTPRGKIQGIRALLLLRVPNGVALDVDLRSGEVFVEGMRSTVEIDVTFGDADLVARHGEVGQVDVDVVAGRAELWLGDGHLKGSGWPRSIKWRGPGENRLNVDVGTGRARIRLEE
jgi:hypothetical protein